MAFQNADKKRKPGAQILRTPAPDEISNLRNPGAFSAGTNGSQPSSVAPGVASESILAQNLRQSQVADTEEDVLSMVIAKGIAGRDDSIPADGNEQTRNVSAKMYPASHGAVRQQQDYASIGRKPLAK